MAAAVLRRCVHPERREEVLADLEEEMALRAVESSPGAARRWYRRQVRGFARQRIREALTGERGVLGLHPARWLSFTDLRVAVRLALRQPVASATAALALATAITLALTGFAVARGLAWPELPIQGGERLYQARIHPEGGGSRLAKPHEVRAWLGGARTPADLGAYQGIVPPLQFGDEAPRAAEGARVTPGAFARISPAPLLGRNLDDADSRAGAEPVVVLREFMWRHPTTFAGDPDAIGSTVMVGGVPHTLVGILPQHWSFPVSQSFWTPLPLHEWADAESSGAPGLVTWLFLSEDGRPEPAQDELAGLARGVAAPGESDVAVTLVPYVEGFSEGIETPLAIVIICLLVGLLSVVALNVSTLVLARCAQRSEELAVRTALGAGRGRLLSQLFLESLVIGVVAAGLGALSADALLDFARPWVEADLPIWFDLSFRGSEFAAAALLAVVASAIAGVFPALRVTARSGVATVLQGSSKHLTPVALGRTTGLLLAFQLAISVGVLTVSALLLEGLWRFVDSDAAPAADRVLTAQIRSDRGRSLDGGWSDEALPRLRTEIETGLAAIPGAERVGLATSLPRNHFDSAVIEVEAEAGELEAGRRAQVSRVGPGFLEVLGLAPLQGRLLEESDAAADARKVAVVSESFVSEVLAGRAPLGRRFRIDGWERPPNLLSQQIAADGRGEWIEIVGIVPDYGLTPGATEGRGEVYLPLVGSRALFAAIRTSGDAEALVPALRRAVAQVDPGLLVTDVNLLSDVGWETRLLLQGGAGTLALAGGMVLLLSLAGIYALASLSVTSRTREIGLRLALGASHSAVLRAVLRPTLIHLGLGAMVGAFLSLGLARATRLLPFPIPATVELALPLVATLMLAAGLLATWIPARRALRVQPMEALRAD